MANKLQNYFRVEYSAGVTKGSILCRIVKCKKEIVTEVWRKLHKAELHGLCTSSDILINSLNKTRWAGCIS
jgi:hypothetical protein